LRGLARLLIVFGVGVGTTLAWQSYGDDARAMIAKSAKSSHSFCTANRTCCSDPFRRNWADGITSVAVHQLALGLAAVCKAGQQQTVADIGKVQTDDQEILHKLLATPQSVTSTPAHKPIPMIAPPSPSPQGADLANPEKVMI
jgi:hypothetical protein